MYNIALYTYINVRAYTHWPWKPLHPLCSWSGYGPCMTMEIISCQVKQWNYKKVHETKLKCCTWQIIGWIWIETRKCEKQSVSCWCATGHKWDFGEQKRDVGQRHLTDSRCYTKKSGVSSDSQSASKVCIKNNTPWFVSVFWLLWSYMGFAFRVPAFLWLVLFPLLDQYSIFPTVFRCCVV